MTGLFQPSGAGYGSGMQIAKSQVVDFLNSHGQGDKAQLVEQHLPDTIDTDQHAQQLQQHGVDVGQLAQGGLGDIGGKLGF
jgi:hypothetical protein